MSRLSYFAFFGRLLWAFVFWLAGMSQNSAAASRPNIVFIFADDHAYQAIGAYGSRVNTTPNIDRIAKEGMLFENCYVGNSICGPSRATILTGKYSHLNGFLRNGNTFDGSQQTFPKLLQKAGYQTAIVGKWHLKTDPTGFDYWQVLIGQGPYYNPPMKTVGADGKTTTVKHEGYTTEVITGLAMDWIKNGRDPNKPFILMFQHKAPHRNWMPGPKQLSLYDDVIIPEPPNLFDEYENRGTPAHSQAMTIVRSMNASDLKLTEPRGLTEDQKAAWKAAYGPKNEAFQKANLEGRDLVRWKYQRYMKDYLRCVAGVDAAVGEMLDYLESSGLAENTLVVYSSDQGFYLGEHGWFDKRWMYEESLRTPLLARWPGVVKPGSRNRKIVSNLDFAETFLDIAGVEVPGDMQGRSLVPLLQGKNVPDWRKTFYYQYYEYPGGHSVRRHYGVVDGRHKLIHFYEPDVNEWELFDLSTDPREMRSVYDQAEYATIQNQLKEELMRLRKELKVPEDVVEPRRRNNR